jgi:hypothetical protein
MGLVDTVGDSVGKRGICYLLVQRETRSCAVRIVERTW